VIVDHYLQVLQEEFLPFLQGMGVNCGETFFATGLGLGHTVNEVL
jgi:hypothetical protein